MIYQNDGVHRVRKLDRHRGSIRIGNVVKKLNEYDYEIDLIHDWISDVIERISQNRRVHRFYPWQLTIMIMMKMTTAVAMINERRLTARFASICLRIGLRVNYPLIASPLSIAIMNLPRQSERLSSGKRIASNLILIDDAYPHKGIKTWTRKINQGPSSVLLYFS